MKFKIKKEIDEIGIWYWTIPQVNIFLRIWYFFVGEPHKPLTPDAESVFHSKEKAIQHIKRWNNGYYKKKYYSEYI